MKGDAQDALQTGHGMPSMRASASRRRWRSADTIAHDERHEACTAWRQGRTMLQPVSSPCGKGALLLSAGGDPSEDAALVMLSDASFRQLFAEQD